MNAPNYGLANPQLKVRCPSPRAAVYPPVPVYHQCIHFLVPLSTYPVLYSFTPPSGYPCPPVHSPTPSVPCPWTHSRPPCLSHSFHKYLLPCTVPGSGHGTGSTERAGLRSLQSGREESHQYNSHQARGKGLVPVRGLGLSGKQGGLLGVGGTWTEV